MKTRRKSDDSSYRHYEQSRTHTDRTEELIILQEESEEMDKLESDRLLLYYLESPISAPITCD